MKETKEAAYNARKVGLERNVIVMVHVVNSDATILVGVSSVPKAIIKTCVTLDVPSFVKFVTDTMVAAKFVFQESTEKIARNPVFKTAKTPSVTRQLDSVWIAFRGSLENCVTKTVV